MFENLTMVDTVNIIFWGCLATFGLIVFVVGSLREAEEEKKSQKIKIGMFDSPEIIQKKTMEMCGFRSYPVNKKES